jgi:Mg-chelatase subunit ChlD
MFLSCDSEDSISSNSRPSLEFVNIQPNHQRPSKVQFIFSLRDNNGHAVLIPQTEFDEAVGITIKENGLQIDYRESHGFVHTAESFGMDVVLVLDYTESMAVNNGIDTMLMGVDSILDGLAESHRVAIVEFHDNQAGDNYSVLQDFTTEKEEARFAIQSFTGAYNGFSTCWDAVYLGLGLFPIEIDSNTVRNLVFLSDGFDNSSIHTPRELSSLAQSIGVRIYNIGVGDFIEPVNEATLREISETTGGMYYRAEELNQLREQFGQIVDDLGGNYKISYITPRRDIFEVEIGISYDGLNTRNPIIASIDGASIFDSDRKGLLSFNEPSVFNETAEMFISADHIPRDITTFRFKIDLPAPIAIVEPIEIISPDVGGLLDDNWTAMAKDIDGYYNTSGPELSFGDSGLLFKINLDNITNPGVAIQITFDNSLYTNDVYFFGGDPSELDLDGNWVKTVVLD